MAELNYIFSFVLKCKPDVFLSVARAYAQENKIECAYPSFGLPERVSNNSNDLLSWQNRFDPNHTCIRMYVSEQDAMTKKWLLHRCEIVALLRSDGVTSDLRVRMVEGEWEKIKAQVNGLLDHLKAKGWIATVAAAQTQPEAQPLAIRADDSTNKKKTNPGVKAHADAIRRLHDGQSREANYYQWAKQYEAEEVSFTQRKTVAAELYRNSVWKPYQKKLTGKI